MENHYLLQVVLAVLGSSFFLWGSLIVGSDLFFEFWNERYWREKNDRHKSRKVINYNRYGTGLATLFLGLGIVWIAFTKL